jgi:WD40 repeat protein
VGSPLEDGRARVAGRLVRLAIWGWAQAGLFVALAGALVLLTAERTPPKDGSPAWATPTGSLYAVRAIPFDPDGRRVANGGPEGAVVVWEVGQSAELMLHGDPPATVICLAFSPDNAPLAAGTISGDIEVFNVASGLRLQVHYGAVWALAFCADGRLLVSGGFDGTLRLWPQAQDAPDRPHRTVP